VTFHSFCFGPGYWKGDSTVTPLSGANVHFGSCFLRPCSAGIETLSAFDGLSGVEYVLGPGTKAVFGPEC